MMRHGKHSIKSYMTLEFEFSGIRVQEGYLTPVDWHLTVNLIAPIKKGKNREESEYRASLVYQKLYFWLDTNLHNVLMVDVNSEDDLYIANLSSNIAVFCPGNPGDDMIVQLLHSKLSKLAGTELVVGEIHLKGNDTSLQYTYDCGEEGYNLPDTTAEYIENVATRDAIPWWSRNDGFCFEFMIPDEEGVDIDTLFADVTDPLDDFEKLISEMSDTRIGITKEPAKIVQIEKWKPKKV